MCGVSLSDQFLSEELVLRLGIIKTIVESKETSQLRWYGRCPEITPKEITPKRKLRPNVNHARGNYDNVISYAHILLVP